MGKENTISALLRVFAMVFFLLAAGAGFGEAQAVEEQSEAAEYREEAVESTTSAREMLRELAPLLLMGSGVLVLSLVARRRMKMREKEMGLKRR